MGSTSPDKFASRLTGVRFSLALCAALALLAGCSADTGAAGPDRGDDARSGRPAVDAAVDRDTEADAARDAAADAVADAGRDIEQDSSADASADAPDAPEDASVDVDLPDADTTDSDGDGIWDALEGEGDVDGDGLRNYEDTDSDGDGIDDRVEYRREPGSGLSPSDLDGDRIPDFLDDESDGDGLLDAEETGCPASTDVDSVDSDRDGFTDLVETAFDADPCDPDDTLEGRVDFFFTLVYEDEPDSAELDIATTLEDGDLVFNMDVTGSMSSAIEGLRTSLSSSIIPALDRRIADVAIAITSFADFPCEPHGNADDEPFVLHQRVTTDATEAQRAVSVLRASGGNDTPESGLEALFQIASGLGRTTECASIPPFDPEADAVEGVADGQAGGVGFRDAQVRVVVQITDAPSHENGADGYPYGATRAEAYQALDSAGAQVIGLAVGEDLGGFLPFESGALDDLTRIARDTGAVVQPCAWGPTGVRPDACGDWQCCTGVDGEGKATDDDGSCPLVFEVDQGLLGGSARVDESVLSGIEAILGGTEYEITARVRPDPLVLADEGIDTTCFLEGVVPLRGTPSGCADTPVPIDTDGDGVVDGFTGIAAGSSVTFEVQAYNDCVQAETDPRVFLAYIDLITTEGDLLGTRIVTVLVPPRPPKL